MGESVVSAKTVLQRCLSFLRDERLYRILLLLALFILPIGYFVEQSLRNPDTALLYSFSSAEWILHPVQKIINFIRGPASEDVLFERSFSINVPIQSLRLKIKAYRQEEVWLNDHRLEPVQASENWTEGKEYELGPYLNAGDNSIRIRVGNPKSLPALLVESPSFLATPSGWKASLGPHFRNFVDAVPAAYHEPKPGPLQTWKGWRWAKYFVIVWLLFALSAGLVALLLPAKDPTAAVDFPRWVRIAVPALLLGAALWINLSNTSHYSYQRAHFDWEGHVAYIHYVSQNWETPIASQGWEMYQPPAYYFLASLVYRVGGGEDNEEAAMKSVQYFGCLVGIGLALMTWLYARLLFPANPTAQWLALLFAVALPMCLYMNSVVTNEVFSGTVIALSIYLVLRFGFLEKITDRESILLGVAAGLALLSKFTAVFSFSATLLVFALRLLKRQTKEECRNLGIYLLTIVLVAGWFYLRNLGIYHAPMVGNFDTVSGFEHIQNPGFQLPRFYLSFGSVFFHHPLSRSTSWFNANYASFWSDVHTNFFSADNDHAYFWTSIMIILAALPSAAMGAGLIKTFFGIMRRPVLNPDLLILAVSIWTWESVIFFTTKVPIHSALKAFYWLSLVPCLGVYLLRGREELQRRLPIARWILDVSILLLAVLGFWLYRYKPIA